MITFDNKMIALLFLGKAPVDGVDWLCGIRELELDKRYEIIYRFRYYKDDKPFDSADKKNWYEAVVSGTRSYTLAVIRELGQVLRSASSDPASYHEFINEGDFKAFTKKCQAAPFMYLRLTDDRDSDVDAAMDPAS